MSTPPPRSTLSSATSLEVHRDLPQGISAESREDAFAIVEQIRADIEAATEPTKPEEPKPNEPKANDRGRRARRRKRRRRRRRRQPVSAAAIEAPRTGRRPVTGLGLLIVALVISIGAYATAGLGLKGRTPRDLIVYGLVFAAVSVTGWMVVRWLAPRADPVLYPVAITLAGLGIAMLYRIMVARGQAQVAREQAIWLIVGIGAFAATLWFLKDDRQLNSYTYTLGLAGLALLLLPVVPGIGYEINGARLWAEPGTGLVPAGGVRKDPDRRVPGGLPGGQTRAAGQRRGPVRACLAPRTLARCSGVGRLAGGAVPGTRHGRVAAVLRRVRRDAVGRQRPGELPVDRAHPVRRRRRHRLPRFQPRAGPRGLLAARVGSRPR